MNTDNIPESNVYKMGFVVRDLDEAMNRYGRLYRIDRWYRLLRDQVGEDAAVSGSELPDDEEYEITVGFARRMEIDLIVVASESDNTYARFLKENGEGLHHISFCVRNIKTAMEDYEKLGYEVISKGVHGEGHAVRYHISMARSDDPDGRVIELSEIRFGALRIMHPPRSLLYSIMSGNLEPIYD